MACPVAVGRRTIAAPKREEVRGDRPGQVGVPFRGLHEILLVDAPSTAQTSTGPPVVLMVLTNHSISNSLRHRKQPACSGAELPAMSPSANDRTRAPT
jgi:hypothetical protein